MDNKYILKWDKLISEAKNALSNNDFELYSNLMAEAEQAASNYTDYCNRKYIANNFGLANHIFEDVLPSAFKNNKKLVKEFINTIKEDKNLLNQFQFYKTIKENTDNSLESKCSLINEALHLLHEQLKPSDIIKSNKKLATIIEKYDARPSEPISNDIINLYEDCNYLITHTKKLSNVNEINTALNNVASYLINHNKNTSVNENKANLLNLIEDFDKKYNNILTEEEKDLVKTIIDVKSEGADAKKMSLFNKLKNECLTNIDKMLIENISDDDKDGLIAIKEQLNHMNYNSESIVSDISKLLEIKDVLMN